MKIVVLKETVPGEARVALMPDSVKKIVALKASVAVESGAGLGAARTDDEYREAFDAIRRNLDPQPVHARDLRAEASPAAMQFR